MSHGLEIANAISLKAIIEIATTDCVSLAIRISVSDKSPTDIAHLKELREQFRIRVAIKK